MLIQKFGYQQLYPDLELTIMQDLENEKLKQIPTLYFNSISTTLKENHEGFIDFKVIELVLIICSVLISLLSGLPYFIISITYQCEIYGQTLSLGAILITLLPLFTLCSHHFKLSLKMMKYIITLWSLFILFEVLVLVYFFFMLITLVSLMRKFRFIIKSYITIHLILQLFISLCQLSYLIYLFIKTKRKFYQSVPNQVQVGQQLMNIIMPISYF